MATRPYLGQPKALFQTGASNWRRVECGDPLGNF